MKRGSVLFQKADRDRRSPDEIHPKHACALQGRAVFRTPPVELRDERVVLPKEGGRKGEPSQGVHVANAHVSPPSHAVEMLRLAGDSQGEVAVAQGCHAATRMQEAGVVRQLRASRLNQRHVLVRRVLLRRRGRRGQRRQDRAHPTRQLIASCLDDRIVLIRRVPLKNRLVLILIHVSARRSLPLLNRRGRGRPSPLPPKSEDRPVLILVHIWAPRSRRGRGRPSPLSL